MTTDTHGSADCKPERTSRTLLDKWTLINRINGDRELKDSSVRIATYLMWKMNCEWETCWPGRQTIAEATGLSVRTIGEGLRELRDGGWITWRERKNADGSHTSSEYRFLWGFDDARDSYVDKQNLPQVPEDPPGEVCQGGEANSASINKGRLTREVSHSSAKNDTPSDQKPRRASAERKSPKGRTSETAPEEPPQEGSRKWWEMRVWNETGERFRERFYVSLSKAAFKKRLGETLRRENWNFEPVDRAMRLALEAEPAGDAFQYVTMILKNQRETQERQRSAAGQDKSDIDYSRPLNVRGVM